MAERILMKGNEAIAEAAIRAGCRHYFGYPITPQTEIAAYMAKKLPKIGGVFLQAESEIASINMVYGAAATGTRVMTSSSSPGISLKSEGLSYIAGSDVPAFVVNVQRGGPGLGGIDGQDALRAGIDAQAAALAQIGLKCYFCHMISSYYRVSLSPQRSVARLLGR